MAKNAKEAKNGLKIVVVGDGAVGKTSILVTLATGKFPKEYIPTVFENHEMDREVDGVASHVVLYDTAGQEEYESLRLLSYPDTDAFLVVFGLNSNGSFENIGKKWLNEVRSHRPGAPCIVVGAKSDLRDDDGVIAELKSLGRPMLEKEEYEKRSLEWGAVKYLECSAAKQENIAEVIDEAIRFARRAQEEENRQLELQKAQKDSAGCCIIC